MQIPTTWRPWILALCAVIAAATGFVVTVNDGGNNTISITVQGPVGPTAVTTTPAALEETREANTHENAKDETPPGVSIKDLAGAIAQQHFFAQRDGLPTTIPDAAPVQPGCRTRLVDNKSSRNGIRPRLLVMHYTVSPNRPGFADVDAITALFNQRSFAASSHFVVDRDGNCNYIVREAEKAWTQAAGNPVSISWEIINTGSERPLFTADGLKRFARTVSDSADRWNIPIQLGKVDGCRVVEPGIIDHNTFGACGGGHHDITPFDVRDLVAAVKTYRAVQSPQARKQARWCRSQRILRAKIRAGKSTPAERARNRQLKKLIDDRGIRCPG